MRARASSRDEKKSIKLIRIVYEEVEAFFIEKSSLISFSYLRIDQGLCTSFFPFVPSSYTILRVFISI